MIQLQRIATYIYLPYVIQTASIALQIAAQQHRTAVDVTLYIRKAIYSELISDTVQVIIMTVVRKYVPQSLSSKYVIIMKFGHKSGHQVLHALCCQLYSSHT